MPAVITVHLAIAAIRLRQQHPNASARDVLDACLRERAGSLADFGREIEPGRPFARLVTEAFGAGPDLAAHVEREGLDAHLEAGEAFRRQWQSEVLPRFAQAYGLST